MCGKRFLLFSVLLLLLSWPIYSEGVYLSEVEYQELMSIFVKLGNQLDEQKQQIAILEAQLALASESQAISAKEIERLLILPNELKKSYEEQTSGVVKRAVLVAVITGLVSAIAGIIAGLLL
jgi:hypothetical protein